MPTTRLSDRDLRALREIAGAGAGTAASALSSLIGRPVTIEVATVLAVPIAQAIEHAGPRDERVTAVALPTGGDVRAVVLVLMSQATVRSVCRALGVEAGSEMGCSALCEVGNILGASYVGALGELTGLNVDLNPPEQLDDMLGAILTSALVHTGEDDSALLLKSTLTVGGGDDECAPSFLFVPSDDGLAGMLARMEAGPA